MAANAEPPRLIDRLCAGHTWSVADAIAPVGVDPHAVHLTPANVIAVVFGRPANYLSFSTDKGRSFEGPWCFYESPSPIYNASTDEKIPYVRRHSHLTQPLCVAA